MKTIQFKCTLLSDVIINQKAATEGNQQTLDFISGSAFLGVAAGGLYNKDADKSLMFTIFHSGKVRFGDAHPLVETKRAVRIPASWYFKKDDTIREQPFVHHGMFEEGLKDDNGNPVQIKQCRGGFMIKNGEILVSEVQINKHFAIKSAYNSESRRSEDAKMYGYESLEAGTVWCFEVTLDQDAEQFRELLIGALVGKKRIGRSSNAQYGLVEIETCIFENPFKIQQPIQVKVKDNEVPSILLYAESRLIFSDDYGQPTFTPTEQQLGLTKGKIDWAKSQIRTFQYAPYNNHRKNRDTDRCGIEKGSVFCVTDASFDDVEKAKMAKGIGLYLNEGFGKVLVNPEFLAYNQEVNGEATFRFKKEKTEKNLQDIHSAITTLPLDISILHYLKKQKALKDEQFQVYSKVNEYVKENERHFKEKFASQWGTIRSIAMKAESKQKLLDDLLKKPKGYLVHGIAAEQWQDRRRAETLEKFIIGLDKGIAVNAVINLAAEMAKKSKKEGSR